MSSQDQALIQALRAALANAPESAPLHKHLGDLLMAESAYAEAIEEYRAALNLDPEDVPLKLALAGAYDRAGKYPVALVILEELLNGAAPSAPVYLLAARVYLAAGQERRAAELYRQALLKDATLGDAELESRLPLGDLIPARASGDAPAAEAAPGELVFVTAESPGGAAEVDIERPAITFNDVGGMEKLKEEIRMKIIYPISHPEIYRAYGKKTGGGILMYGPPGCGKTYIARATAGEVHAAFMSVGLHEVLDMYLGQSEQNLHRIFDLARRNTPCVLFFDEVDALGAKRSDMRTSGIRQVINQFLAEMDGVNTSNEGVLILAATNAPWHLDSALRRPGRFDRVLFVSPPDALAREAILRLMLSGKPVQDMDYSRLARETEGFSGADMQGVIDRAVEAKLHEAMKSGLPRPLKTADLLAVIKTVRPTTQEWFETARNYALYANQGGAYDDVLAYLKQTGRGGLFSR